MARLELKGFPAAPADGWWCTACAVLAKGTVLARQRELIEAGLADDERESFAVQAQHGEVARLTRMAVAWAPSVVTGGAVVPLCWEHLLAVDPAAPEPGPEAPPGGGLVLPPNDRRRRGLS